MKTSLSGVAALTFFEGERLTAYQDSVGVWTIGVGHAATSGRPPIPKAGMTITHQQALEILAADLVGYENAVAQRLPKVLQNVFDGAVSFCFNLGPGNFAKATWPKLYLAGDMAGAEASLKQWTQAGGHVLPGLVRRRDEEADIIFRDKYPDGILSPSVSKPPPPAGQPGASPVPSILDPIRGVLDNADNKLDAIVDSIDKAKSIPFVGSLISPYVTYVDEFRVLIDTIRKQVDAADPTPPKS